MIGLAEQPWWTSADEAELDLLVHELVRVAFLHRDRCATCNRDRWCDALRDATAALLEWRAGRVLRSKAAWLRIRQQAREDLGMVA
jgi:hypothetical protein